MRNPAKAQILSREAGRRCIRIVISQIHHRGTAATPAGMEYVDVISAHRPDNLTPIEETVRGASLGRVAALL